MVVADKDLSYQLFIKTHRLTVVVAAPVLSTVSKLKDDVLSALQQFTDEESAAGVPSVSSVDDFEICRSSNGKYEIISTSGAAGKKTIRDTGLKAWERLFLRFRDEEGVLQDVEVTIPPTMQEDEEDEAMS